MISEYGDMSMVYEWYGPYNNIKVVIWICLYTRIGKNIIDKHVNINLYKIIALGDKFIVFFGFKLIKGLKIK